MTHWSPDCTEWHWSWLHCNVLMGNFGSWYSCGWPIITLPNIVSDKANPIIAVALSIGIDKWVNSTDAGSDLDLGNFKDGSTHPVTECGRTHCPVGWAGGCQCHGGCACSTRVFGLRVCVSWCPRKCQDPSRTLHCSEIISVIHLSCQWV